MQFLTAYHWQKGVRTEKNQDSLALCQMVVRRKRCLMAVVCDGIGSLPESEKISGYVTEQLINWFFGRGTRVIGSMRGGMIKNIVKRRLYRIRGDICNSQKGQWGCTLSMLLICENRYWIWNVGDSRIYRCRWRRIKALTRDDVQNDMLTRCMGSFEWHGTSFKSGHVMKNDVFLVCSDGFYHRLSKSEMKMIMTAKVSNEEQAQRLLREAVQRLRSKGEKDDVSVIYVKEGGLLCL